MLGEEPDVDDVEAVEFVGPESVLSTDVGRVRVGQYGPGLVRAAGDRDIGLHVREPVKQVAGL
jgi:hypothetical protein